MANIGEDEPPAQSANQQEDEFNFNFHVREVDEHIHLSPDEYKIRFWWHLAKTAESALQLMKQTQFEQEQSARHRFLALNSQERWNRLRGLHYVIKCLKATHDTLMTPTIGNNFLLARHNIVSEIREDASEFIDGVSGGRTFFNAASADEAVDQAAAQAAAQDSADEQLHDNQQDLLHSNPTLTLRL